MLDHTQQLWELVHVFYVYLEHLPIQVGLQHALLAQLGSTLLEMGQTQKMIACNAHLEHIILDWGFQSVQNAFLEHSVCKEGLQCACFVLEEVFVLVKMIHKVALQILLHSKIYQVKCALWKIKQKLVEETVKVGFVLLVYMTFGGVIMKEVGELIIIMTG